MSIRTRWLDDSHTIIYQTFDTDWTLEEFSSQFHQVEDYMVSVDHEVDLLVEIVNVSPDGSLPVALGTIEGFPRKIHAVVVVSEDAPTRPLMALVNEITPSVKKSPIVIVDDLPAAYEVLQVDVSGAA